MSNYVTGTRLEPHELRAWRGCLRAHASLPRELDAELVAAHGLQLTSFEGLLFLSRASGGRRRRA